MDCHTVIFSTFLSSATKRYLSTYLSRRLIVMNIPRLNVSLMAAAMVFLSGTFLFYTAVIAPAQIFLWESDETECKFFPTLYFDLCVDTFFMVSFVVLSCCCMKKQI
jgi:hypothetical protein